MVSFIYLLLLPQSLLRFYPVGIDSSINVLPDDTLVEIFDVYRLEDDAWIHGGWYKLAHTCRRWRNIIFSFPSRLEVHLYCTYGSPVADMLSHSPPLPLIIEYYKHESLSTKEEEGVFLALQKHDRVRHIHLCALTITLHRLFAAMNGPFPMLDYLDLFINTDGRESESEELDRPRLPRSFQAPRLLHLGLSRVGDVTEVGLSLLASLSSLVYLSLIGIPASSILPVDQLTSCLSSMPQLEYIRLIFGDHLPSEDITEEPTNPPNVKRISLLNLNGISFRGDSSYLEALAAQIIAPHVMTFHATFLDQPPFTLPHLSGLLTTAAGLRLPIACIKFPCTCIDSDSDDPNVGICMATPEQILGHQPYFPPFKIVFSSWSPHAQVVSAGKICAALSPMFSAVERLHLYFNGTQCQIPHDRHIENARWHDLLRPFRKVKRLQVDAQLRELGRALSPNENGPSMEILPELHTLLRSDGVHFRDAFDGFIAARRDRGQRIVKRQVVPILYMSFSETSDEEEDEEENKVEKDEEKEDNEGETKLQVEDEREEAEGGSADAHAESGIGTAIHDDPGYFTDLGSDSDFDPELKSWSVFC